MTRREQKINPFITLNKNRKNTGDSSAAARSIIAD